MLNLNDCQLIINKYINELNLPKLPANLYDPIRYMLDLEAKRIRPCMVLMGCNLYQSDVKAAIYPALAIEVFHNFTLVHDDIMDRSLLRRKKPTVHSRWNSNIAILSGDAMLIKAYELLTFEPFMLKQILPVFNQTALQVCEGQQYDMDFEISAEVSLSDYLNMIELKTAVLLAASLKIGAIIGGAKKDEAELLYEFGRNLGIAFQLKDDLMDIFSETSVFGKTKGNDIISNKKTILLIEALNRSEGKVKQELLKWLNAKNFNRDEKIEAIFTIYQTLKLDEVVNDQIRFYHKNAMTNLENIPIKPDTKIELKKISEFLMNRNK